MERVPAVYLVLVRGPRGFVTDYSILVERSVPTKIAFGTFFLIRLIFITDISRNSRKIDSFPPDDLITVLE